MDFDLTEDQRAFQATARQFARDEMAPKARAWSVNALITPIESPPAVRPVTFAAPRIRAPSGICTKFALAGAAAPVRRERHALAC